MHKASLFLNNVVGKVKRHHFIQSFFVLIADRVFQLAGQLFTVFVLTNYLGAEKFGILMYALSILGLLLTLSSWGQERVLVIELVEHNDAQSHGNIITSGLIIKSIISLLVITVLQFAYPLVANYISIHAYRAVQILSLACFFNNWVVFDAWNQKNGLFQRTAFARIFSVIVVLLLRVVIVVNNMPFNWLLLTYVFEHLLNLIIIAVVSQYTFSWRQVWQRFSFHVGLLKSGFLVLFSSICIIAYMRASQGIVENKFSAVFLGIYSLAISFIEIPIALASVLSTILTPSVSAYNSRAATFAHPASGAAIGLFFVVGLLSAALILLAGLVLSLFLSGEYNGFYNVLLQGSFTLPLIFLGACFNMLLITSKRYKLYLVITILSALVTVAVLIVLSRYVTEQTAIYLYIASQLVANMLVPIVLSRELRQSLILCVRRFVNGGLLSDIKLLTINKGLSPKI